MTYLAFLIRFWWAPVIAAMCIALAVSNHRTDKAELRIANLQAEHAATMRGISDLATAAAEKAAADQQRWAGLIAAADTRITKEKDDALRENEYLRRSVADGTRRLRIRASCPASGGDVPQAATAPGMDAQGTVELDAATGQSVYDLRKQLIEGRAALTGLQEYVRAIAAP